MRGTFVLSVQHEYNLQPLIDARKARGLSLRKAAQEIGINFITLCRIENGTHNTTFETIKMLCEYYDIPLKSVILKNNGQSETNFVEMLA